MITDFNADGMMQWRLNNFLRGQANNILNSIKFREENPKGIPISKEQEEQYRQEMQVIEEYTQYIRDYKKNKKLLEEYKQLMIRLEDDGR